MQSVATNRMIAFTEYLSEDFEMSVFALDNHTHVERWNNCATIYYTESTSIFDKIRSDSSDSKWKHRFKTALRVLISKFVKNPLHNWRKNVTQKLEVIHQEYPFDLIISSFSPQEAHLAVLEFKKKNKEVKWIADMRDEMSKNPGISQDQERNLKEIESLIDKYASAITSVSKPIIDDFRALCPNVVHFEEIRNGFNHQLKSEYQPKNTTFTIGYFGSFYGGRKPATFFKALELLTEKRSDFNFKFVIVGAHRNFEIPAKFEKMVDFRSPLPYLEAIKLMMQMDLNVVIHPRSNQKGVFTGKLFDYISTGQPVLTCVDKDDVAAKLVLDFGAGYVAECDDLSENVKALERAFDDWKNNLILVASEENRLSLHRKNQVKKLNRLIQQLVS